jgi:membrane anchored protein
MAIFCSGVLYAPLPLIAQNGGGQTPLIPVADMPSDNGGATAPSEPPLEIDPEEAPELVPPQSVGGGAEAPSRTPAPAPAPAPEPAGEPTAAVAMPQPEPAPAEPAQAGDQEPEGEEPAGQVPDEAPTAPEPQQEPDQQAEDDEEFEEEFDDVPEPGEPNAPSVVPEASAGPQLPRTGADLPALLLSGLALTASGMSLRALCRGRS